MTRRQQTPRARTYARAEREAYRLKRQTGTFPSVAELAQLAKCEPSLASLVLTDIATFGLQLEGLQLTLMGRAERLRQGYPASGDGGPKAALAATALEALADSLPLVPPDLAQAYRQAWQLDDQEPPMMRRIESAMIEAVIEGKPMPNATAFIARALRLLERVSEQQQGQSPTVH